MRVFVKLQDVWREVHSADSQGNVAVMGQDGVERYPAEAIQGEYIHEEPDYEEPSAA